MIDVQQGSLSPLEQDRFSAPQRVPDDAARIDGDGKKPRRKAIDERAVFLRIRPIGGPQHAEYLVRAGDPLFDELLGALQIPEVAHTNAAAPVLVLVRGTDAPPRGPDLLLLLTGPVEQLVIGKREMRAV